MKRGRYRCAKPVGGACISGSCRRGAFSEGSLVGVGVVVVVVSRAASAVRCVGGAVEPGIAGGVVVVIAVQKAECEEDMAGIRHDGASHGWRMTSATDMAHHFSFSPTAQASLRSARHRSWLSAYDRAPPSRALTYLTSHTSVVHEEGTHSKGAGSRGKLLQYSNTKLNFG